MSHSSTSSSDDRPVGYDAKDLVPLCGTVCSTPWRKAVACAVFGIFVLTTAGSGIVDAVWPQPLPKLVGIEREREEKTRAAASFKDGSLARQIERDARTRSTVRYWGVPYHAGFLAHWFREADATTVVLGRDGWMFMHNRVVASKAPTERLTDHNAALVSAIARRLCRIGTRLYLMPIPRKIEMYADRLHRNVYDIRPDLYPKLIDGCRRRGVDVIDIEPVWRARRDIQLYCKTDSHWAPAGELIAAEAVAVATGLLVPPEARSTRTVEKRMVAYGDLLRLIGALRADGTGARFLTEEVPTFEIFRVSDGTPAPYRGAKTTNDCALVGTSFSAEFQRFPTYLWHHTERNWWLGSARATGPVQPLRSALSAFEQSGFPKILVWEVPAHYFFCMQSGLDGMGAVFAALKTTGLAPLSDDAAGTDPFFAPTPTTRPGRLEILAEPVFVNFVPSRLVDSADGTTSVRLRCTIDSGTLRFGVDGGTGRLTADLKPGVHDVALPIVASTPGGKIRCDLRGLSGPVVVHIQSIDVVAALTPMWQVAGIPRPRAADRGWRQEIDIPASAISGAVMPVVRVEIPRLAPETYPLSVSIAGAWTLPISSPASRHSVFLTVPAPTSREPLRVIVEGRGDPPAAAALSVTLATTP